MIMIRNNFKKYKVADSPTGRLAPYTYMSAKTSAKNFKNHFSQKILHGYDGNNCK